MFCTNCGFKMESDAKFCTACGTAVEEVGAQEYAQGPVQQPMYVYPQWQHAPLPPAKKSKALLGIIAGSVVVVIALVVVAIIVFGGGDSYNEEEFLSDEEDLHYVEEVVLEEENEEVVLEEEDEEEPLPVESRILDGTYSVNIMGENLSLVFSDDTVTMLVSGIQVANVKYVINDGVLYFVTESYFDMAAGTITTRLEDTITLPFIDFDGEMVQTSEEPQSERPSGKFVGSMTVEGIEVFTTVIFSDDYDEATVITKIYLDFGPDFEASETYRFTIDGGLLRYYNEAGYYDEETDTITMYLEGFGDLTLEKTDGHNHVAATNERQNILDRQSFVHVDLTDEDMFDFIWNVMYLMVVFVDSNGERVSASMASTVDTIFMVEALNEEIFQQRDQPASEDDEALFYAITGIELRDFEGFDPWDIGFLRVDFTGRTPVDDDELIVIIGNIIVNWLELSRLSNLDVGRN